MTAVFARLVYSDQSNSDSDSVFVYFYIELTLASISKDSMSALANTG